MRCVAAMSFVISENPRDTSGWMSGKLVLPARGMKDTENVGKCYQLFVLSECQDGAVELAIAHPATDNCWIEKTVQRVLLRRGDTFTIPPGNLYRLENHSPMVSALLNWTIIQTLSVPDAQGMSDSQPAQGLSDSQSKDLHRTRRQCFDAKGVGAHQAKSDALQTDSEVADEVELLLAMGGGWAPLEDDLIICVQSAIVDKDFTRTEKCLQIPGELQLSPALPKTPV